MLLLPSIKDCFNYFRRATFLVLRLISSSNALISIVNKSISYEGFSAFKQVIRRRVKRKFLIFNFKLILV